LYHYAGNNPINYTDPDGREDKYLLLKTQTPQRIEKFYNAKSAVLNNFDNIIKVLKNYNDPTFSKDFNKIKNAASKWLKIELDSAEKISSFTKNLEDMKNVLDTLDSNNVKYDPNDIKHVAKVSETWEGQIILWGSEGKKELVLCDSFFYNETNRERTLVHEMTHFVLGTRDISYDRSKYPDLDKNNAGNWEEFYSEVTK
jgi:hypothetical protein